jgi:hypothetical protein
MNYDGVLITLPTNIVFVPGFICQLIVNFCQRLKVSPQRNNHYYI